MLSELMELSSRTLDILRDLDESTKSSLREWRELSVVSEL